MNFTREQEDAIFISGSNLLVSAGAGSGKTAVLVERIINKITNENPIDVDRLLVVTFTNAAATEMRERILKRITEELQNRPNDRNLIKQAALINRASIMTIDAFCKRVVEQNFQATNLDPQYRIINEDELVMLRLETLSEVLEDFYEEGDEDFLNLSTMLGGQKNDDLLEDYILSLARFSESFTNPDEWIRRATRTYDMDKDSFHESFFYKETIRMIKESIDEALNLLQSAIETSLGDPYLIDKGLNKFLEDDYIGVNDIKEKIENAKNYDDIRLAFKEYVKQKFKVIQTKKEGLENAAALKEIAKAKRDEAVSIIDDAKKNLILQDEKTLLEYMAILNKPIQALGEVTIAYRNRINEKKKEKNRADFSDIAHTALNILVDENGNPTVYAKKYQDLYLEIMIDEYQDSNDIQELILNSISKNKDNIFMVGDVKQSIYRFRQAKPELFLNKYEEYKLSTKEENEVNEVKEVNEVNSNVGNVGKKVLLYKNFRSRDNVITAVNTIFKALMSKEAGEIDYTKDEELILGANFDEVNKYPMEVNLINLEEIKTEDQNNNKEGTDVVDAVDTVDTSNTDEQSSFLSEDDEEVESSKTEVEAKFVANRIVELRKENPKLKYSDIVILLRATSKVANVYKSALTDLNIPVFQDSNSGYFENIEVRTIMALLKVIDNPMQDIALIATLRSPLFNFNEKELIEIRVADKENRLFYEALKLKAKDEDEVGIKCRNFIDTLGKWQNDALHMPLDEFIWMIYKETAYYEYVEAMPNGVQRAANLRVLFQRAGDFEKTTYKGLFNFIRYVDKLNVASGDLGEAKIISEKEDVVRIMSIHKSKGLEFPVVFLSNLSKSFNRMDQNKSLVIHGEIGVGAKYLDNEYNVTSETLQKRVIKNIINKESISEEMRVLYVALTRAKERLILSGTVDKREKKFKTWYSSSKLFKASKKSSFESLRDRCYLDWIMPILMNEEEISNEELLDGKYHKYKDFEITNHFKNEIINQNNSEKDITYDSFYNGEKLEDKELLDTLNFKYGKLEETRLPSKVSVSVIKKLAMEENENLKETYSILDEEYDHIKEVKRPRFLSDDPNKLTGADRGTAFHTVMMHIDPSLSTIEEIDKAIEVLVDKEIMLKVEADSVNRKKVLNFLKSDLGIRFRQAEELGHLYKEEMFYEALEANTLFKDVKSSEKISMVGIIDAFFEEDGELVLLDYKTDAINPNIPDYLINKYKKQIELYKNALEKITGKKVKESYLYSVSEEKVVRVF